MEPSGGSNKGAHVLIIGAGATGCLLAHGLQKV